MTTVNCAILRGAIAGAAGTVALDLVTYGDMAVRGRAPSDMPAEVIRLLAERAGIEPLAKPDDETDDATKHRRTALGAISGYKIGVLIGALYGAAQPLFGNAPLLVRAAVVGGLAMAASDVPATMLGATDPKQWDAGSWVSDIGPHLVYGLVTAAVFEAIS